MASSTTVLLKDGCDLWGDLSEVGFNLLAT
jgi:hypothetical protein